MNISRYRAACYAVIAAYRQWLGVAFAVLGLMLTGCAQGPERRYAQLVRQQGLQAGWVTAGGFRLRFYAKPGARGDQPVDVYLEGDGTPWSSKTRVARDPTSRQAMGLRLMLQPPGPARYLARPCYHALQAQPPCTPDLWTHARYSETVVQAMARGLRELLATQVPDAGIRLIGYSGGGVLAMLLAERLRRVTAVVTVAANLDIAAWTRLHGFSELNGSLNPAKRPPLPRRVRQVHLAGGVDRNVPPGLIRRAVESQAGAEVYVLDSFDHSCCWEKHWAALYGALDRIGDLCAGLSALSDRLACRALRSNGSD